MELKQRKKINNSIPHFNTAIGADSYNPNNIQENANYFRQQSNNMGYVNPYQQNQQYQYGQYNPNTMNSNQIIQGVQNNGPQMPQNNTNISGMNVSKSGSSFGGKAGSVANGVTTIANNFIGQTKNVKSTDSLMSEAGTSDNSVLGVSFQQQNAIDDKAAMNEVNSSGFSSTLGSAAAGATAGACFGPWGAAIGGVVGLASGLFGYGRSKSKQRKAIYNAQQKVLRRNAFTRSSAETTGLQTQYNQEYGNTQDDVLYANHGKDYNFKYLKRPIYE